MLENRYLVMKYTDLLESLSIDERSILAALAIKNFSRRSELGKPDLATIVVESDWPEYNAVLTLLSSRINGSELPYETVSSVQDDPEVSHHLMGFLEDPTDDSAFHLVRVILTTFGGGKGN